MEFMRRLSKVVNIVPVIAKADTLTLEERDFFKQTVRAACRACIYELGILCRDRPSSTANFPASGKMFPSMSESKMAVLAAGLLSDACEGTEPEGRPQNLHLVLVGRTCSEWP